jgi:hypothetical protein
MKNANLSDPFPEREQDRYVSRGLAYIILLNGIAALVLLAALSFSPQSTMDSHRLAWAMRVFGFGAIAGLLSSLLAYVGRIVMVVTPSRLIMRDLLRVGAIVAAVGSGAAFLTGLNMVALTVPESSRRHPKTKPENQAPASVATRATPFGSAVACSDPQRVSSWIRSSMLSSDA